MEKPRYPGEYCPSGGSKAKNLRPLGFLALELPRDNIHQDTPSAFPHIVSIFAGLVGQLVVCHAGARLTFLMLLWPLKMLKLSHLPLEGLDDG